ncbi:MAG: DUF6111 family protein [Alphaproteobacteria bacterium]
MIRILLTTVVPLLLPLAIYVGWVVLARRAAAGVGAAARIPWTSLLLAGFLLMAATMVGVAFLGGTQPWADYQPARWQGGVVVPGGPK